MSVYYYLATFNKYIIQRNIDAMILSSDFFFKLVCALVPNFSGTFEHVTNMSQVGVNVIQVQRMSKVI